MYIYSTSESSEASFEVWRQTMISKSPTFQFWDLIMEFEIMVLIFVHAHRTKISVFMLSLLKNMCSGSLL